MACVQAWVIRYFVVGTGEWLKSRRVLISPLAIDHPTWSGKVIPVSITREQVKNSPDIDIDTEKPVSRQMRIVADIEFHQSGWRSSTSAPSKKSV